MVPSYQYKQNRNINIIMIKIMTMMMMMIIIIIAIMIMMTKMKLIVAFVIIVNNPFQPDDFSTGSTTGNVHIHSCHTFLPWPDNFLDLVPT